MAPKRLPRGIQSLRHKYRAQAFIAKKNHTGPLRATLTQATRDLNIIRRGGKPEKKERALPKGVFKHTGFRNGYRACLVMPMICYIAFPLRPPCFLSPSRPGGA